MIKVGDLVRFTRDLGNWHSRNPHPVRGAWLVIQIDSWSWVCQAIQGNKNEWFDIGQVEVVTHD